MQQETLCHHTTGNFHKQHKRRTRIRMWIILFWLDHLSFQGSILAPPQTPRVLWLNTSQSTNLQVSSHQLIQYISHLVIFYHLWIFLFFFRYWSRGHCCDCNCCNCYCYLYFGSDSSQMQKIRECIFKAKKFALCHVWILSYLATFLNLLKTRGLVKLK